MSDWISFPNLFSNKIEIDRVAFKLFGTEIYWYGILIALGSFLAVTYTLKRAKSFGLIQDKMFDVIFAGSIAGIIGARAYYVLFSGYSYTLRTAVFGIRDGGLAIYGGIILSAFTAVVFSKIIKIRILPVLDLAGLGFLIGQAIGRWGNFFNQEAFGEPTAANSIFGMTGSIIEKDMYVVMTGSLLPESGQILVHPCFLYESFWCSLGFVLLHSYSKKRRFDGEIFLLYAGWYGLGRMFIEGLRMDSLYVGDYRISQIVALISVIASATLVIYVRLKLKNMPDYKMARDNPECIAKIESYPTDIKIEKEKKLAVKALRKAKKEQEERKSNSILGK
ncbi:MAG: prolipoprotein diacylglyceryl transferase [Eubacterium sp.]|jgi:phosphatidylglycerol:prolipoprotein diacylglycerol transferase|nr:prolipoprotein diacylglyceryl transferase [Eubacterium sp.]